MRRQSPIPGGRERLFPNVEAAIKKAVQRHAERFDCSEAFVVTTALADVFGIEVSERYDDGKATRKRRKRRTNAR